MIDQLREDLKRDEGVVYKIYLDHLGLPTFGIGHLITKNDPEHGQPVGTPVSVERVNEAFFNDVEVVLKECAILFHGFKAFPKELRLIIANMMFNLGRPRLSTFKKFIAAVNSGDYATAAVEMRDSKWYRQVTDRAERLAKRMEAVTAVCPHCKQPLKN